MGTGMSPTSPSSSYMSIDIEDDSQSTAEFPVELSILMENHSEEYHDARYN